jgi:CRISPR-associated protein Cas1
MESLYVIEPGAYLRREGKMLKVVKDAKVVETIPAEGLQRLVLVGYVSLSGPVLDFLINRRVETVFVTPTGRFRARLALDEHKHVQLRSDQYLRLNDKAFVYQAAKRIVSGKITNMVGFLLLRARRYKSDELRVAAAKLKSLLPCAPAGNVLDRLRGIEGAATRAYYAAFNLLIRNERFEFRGRNRRPPLDPVNAMLSFVYTMLTNEVLSAVKTVGLDPYLGALHDVSYGRPSLACDLVEEYRAFLGDRMVLSLINLKVIRPEDFVYRSPPPAEFVDEEEMKRKRPVEMKPATCRAFIATYGEVMKREVYYPPLNKNISYRFLMLNQARRFAEFLQDPENEYQPFQWEY